VQDDIQQRAVNLHAAAVVVNESQFPKRFMKKLMRERGVPTISASIS